MARNKKRMCLKHFPVLRRENGRTKKYHLNLELRGIITEQAVSTSRWYPKVRLLSGNPSQGHSELPRYF